MPRRKRKKKAVQSAKPLRREKPAQGPFAVLSTLRIVPPDSLPPEPPPRPINHSDDETDLFHQAMAEVIPLEPGVGRITGGANRRVRRPKGGNGSEDLEVLTHLVDLVSGRVQFDIVDSDEYLEGHIRGLNPYILEKLRRGKFSVQAYFDLHGLTVAEAEQEVRKFITHSMALGYRCVLLIHGRGLNSKDQIPVLKRRLDSILLSGPTRKKILAFTSARPHDGGAGASYVLLRAKKT